MPPLTARGGAPFHGETIPPWSVRREHPSGRQVSIATADKSTVGPKVLSLAVGAGFFLTGGATVAVIAILVFAPFALLLAGERTNAPRSERR